MSLGILFFVTFSSPTYNVFNFQTFKATSIKFNHFKLHKATNKSVENFNKTSMQSMYKQFLLTQKDFSLAKELTLHKIILLRFFLCSLCLHPLISFAFIFVRIALIMVLAFSFNSYLSKMVLISPSCVSRKSFGINA